MGGISPVPWDAFYRKGLLQDVGNQENFQCSWGLHLLEMRTAAVLGRLHWGTGAAAACPQDVRMSQIGVIDRWSHLRCRQKVAWCPAERVKGECRNPLWSFYLKTHIPFWMLLGAGNPIQEKAASSQVCGTRSGSEAQQKRVKSNRARKLESDRRVDN